jgi:hypothetical protein
MASLQVDFNPKDEHKLQHFTLFKEMGRYQQLPKTLHHKRPLDIMGNLLKNCINFYA